MTHRFTDTVTVDGSTTRKREGGYLVADARVARTGIQEYRGSEVGRPDMDIVRVYRDETEVFDRASMASFSGIPITNDHPSEPVTADNWSKYAKGQTDTEVARDGERLRVPLMVADAATIAEVEAGKKELSAGYTCELDWLGGVTADGKLYDARQTNIRANHVAIVAAGRAGSQIRIGDDTNKAAALRTSWGVAPLTNVDHKETNMSNLQTVVLGDKAVSVDPAHVAIVDAFKAQAAADADKAKSAEDMQREIDELKAKNDKLEKDMAKKDGKIADMEKTKVGDADMAALIQDGVALLNDAKTVSPDLALAGLSGAALRKAVVVDKLGEDAIKDKSDVYIDARFDVLVEQAVADKKADPFQKASVQHDRKTVLGDKNPQTVRDAAYGGYLDQLNGKNKKEA